MNPPRILVVGDAMLDRYWDGVVDRQSREAPVPVLRVTRRYDRAGGAANVAVNLAALGVRVTLLALVGHDAAGDVLAGLLHEAGVDFVPIHGPQIATIEKIRCVSQHMHLLRADVEMAPSPALSRAIAERFAALVAAHDLVVMSDHASGALADCARMISAARAEGRPVLVDPRGSDWARFTGATLFKPNRAELEVVLANGGKSDDERGDKSCDDDRDGADDARFQARADALRRDLGWQHLLVTHGEHGMTLFGEGGVARMPASVRDPREVRDVSGAGDTVIATLAWRLGAGDDVAAALRWANLAAGLVVREFGTTVIVRDQLVDAMARAGRSAGSIPVTVSSTSEFSAS